MICFRIGASSVLMLTRKWTFLFHNTRGIPCLAEELLVSHEGLCYMGLIILPNEGNIGDPDVKFLTDGDLSFSTYYG